MTNGASWKLAAVVLSAYVCALVVLCTPRPIARPMLWAAAPEPTATRSCGGPRSAELLGLRKALQGSFAAELGQPRDRHVIAAEQDALRSAALLLVSRGESELAALHAALLCDLDAALLGVGPGADAVLGRFAEQLEAEEVVDARGRLLLPRSTLDALYLVRVNVALGLPELSALAPSAQRAYTGALAFHLRHAPLARRLWAARSYRALGGAHADEAFAQLALAEGQFEDALAHLSAAHARTGELRADNAARGVARELGQRAHPLTSPQP
jgi:hypothetical protein